MMVLSESSRIRFHDSIVQTVNGLPAELRSLVILRYREKFSYEDIATRMSVSPDGVSSRLCQAALRLHAKLGMYLGDSDVGAMPEPVMISNDCRIAERCLAQYVDQTLASCDRPGVERHLEAC